MWTLVTGGAGHLGAALCLSLAESGRSVVVHYYKGEDRAREIVQKCQSYGVDSAAIQGDFSNALALDNFIKRYLRLYPETNCLLNNAGDYLVRPPLHTTVEEWTRSFQVHLHAPFALSCALKPSLIMAQGNIINIGVAGLHRRNANTYSTAYTLAKQGLWGLTAALALELAPQRVRVNMVSPGELEKSQDHHKIPMGRAAACSEVCRVVKFLLEPESAYITGQNNRNEVDPGLGEHAISIRFQFYGLANRPDHPWQKILRKKIVGPANLKKMREAANFLLKIQPFSIHMPVLSAVKLWGGNNSNPHCQILNKR